MTIEKFTPRTGEKQARILLVERRHLIGNFVGRQKIVGVQPLDVVSTAEGKGPISSGRGALILLGDDRYAARFELASNRQGFVNRSIVDDNDFGWRPGLAQSGFNRLGDPPVRVEGWDKYRYEWFHRGSQLLD